MKFCPECGSKRGHNTNVCNCGFEYNRQRKNLYTPKEEHIKEFKDKRGSKRKTLAIGTLIITLIFIFLFQSSEAVFFLGFAGLVMLYHSLNSQLSEKTYHSLAGSKNERKDHQCLFCGHPGIYRSTIYKSNTVVCRCSKCKEILFTE